MRANLGGHAGPQRGRPASLSIRRDDRAAIAAVVSPLGMIAGRRETWFHAACLVVTPWLELLINRNLFITPGGNGYLDPWFYTGFFLSLPEFLTRFAGTYYGARISWLVPGYLAHRVFSSSPVVAN